MTIGLAAIVALALARVGLALTRTTYASTYHGYGCLDAVAARQAEAPQAYRILMPWLIAVAERLWPSLKSYRLTALYEPLRLVALAWALWLTGQAVGERGALLVAVLLPVTFYFDYWDWVFELAGLAGALTGNLGAALAGGVLHAASRETAPLGPLVYGAVSGDWAGMMWLLLVVGTEMLLIRLYVGRRPLNCGRWLWRLNWWDLKNLFRRNRPWYLSEMAMALLLTGLTLVAVATGRAGPSWFAPMVLLLTGWTLGRAAEVRVFAGCLLWVAMLV